MMKKLKEAIKKRPALYVLAKKLSIQKTFFRRILTPAFLWPLLRSISPISKKYGFDRGKPIDRYFIEKFLKENVLHIRGVCLEIKNNIYTKKYGGTAVGKSDVLDINPMNTAANIHDDLRTLTKIENNTYDCIILTQVLQFIDDYESAIKECHRILKPGGHLLVTLPFISRIDIGAGEKGDFWRFTNASAHYAFEKYFLKSHCEIQSVGNVLVGLGFWIGLSLEDLSRKKFDYNDSNFPLIISVSARK